MTDKDKEIIRKQIVLNFIKTPSNLPVYVRLKFAIDKGLNQAQKIIDNRKE